MATRKRIWYRLSCRILPLVFIVLTYDLCSITASEDRALVSHLEPFGNHRPPDVVTEERSTVPNPAEFWKSYVAKRRPVVFRGAATRSGAFELWTEEYLISNYGDLIVRLEARSESNDRLPFGETGVLGRDTIRHFIQNYHTMDAYVISQIPQPMEKDISIPPCLRCGSFNESIQEVHLFLTAGGGQTKLHKDPYSNIHCVFNGTKDWILVHPDQTNLLYMSEDSEFEWGGFSVIDVDSVDLERFPKITDVHYSKVTMNKGDCIFMPGGYWHQVCSKGHLNSAVSIWFSQLRQFTGDGCEIMNVDFTPMDQVLILWRYSGYGDLSQGHMDMHILKRLLLTSADGEGKVWLKEFALKFFKSESEFKTSLLRDDETKRAHKMTEYLDPTGKGYITQEEVKSFSLEQLKELVLFVDPNDVSNTEDFEYSHIDGDAIRQLLRVCENEKGNFDKDTFIASYVKFLGGTPNKALEITKNLGIQDEELSMTDVLNRAPKALHKFYSSRIHDPTFERKMFQHLRVHDEL